MPNRVINRSRTIARIREADYYKSVLSGLVKKRVVEIPYHPRRRQLPERVLDGETGWKGIESILGDLIEFCNINTDSCLEFGVEHGYSAAAFSCFFKSVIGVDIFTGDIHTKNFTDIYPATASRLASFDNIKLIRSDYRQWIKQDAKTYDMIHVDIVHTYADTFACGLWSANHSKCTIFHDTESFPAVKQAVIDIARHTGKKFYNFQESNGLGILV